jgi:hypothetical protein
MINAPMRTENQHFRAGRRPPARPRALLEARLNSAAGRDQPTSRHRRRRTGLATGGLIVSVALPDKSPLHLLPVRSEPRHLNACSLRRGGVIMRLVMAGAMVVALAGVATAAPKSDQREAQARTLFFKGDYQRALDMFAALFAESADPVLLRNIGRCHQKLQQPGEAIEAFRGYLRRSPKLKPSEREEISGFIREMEALKTKQDTERAAAPPEPKPVESTARPTGPARADTGSGTAGSATAPVPPPRALHAQATEPSVSPPGTDLTAGATDDRGRDDAAAAGESGSILRKWWFWTGVGAVVVGGVVTAVVISRGGGGGEPPCPAGTLCPM